jgi:hypothetical protein
MTDEQIISDLHSASEWFTEHGRNTNTAIIGICDRAVDLINRQKAENERLNGELVDRGLLPTIALYDYNTKQIRAEAINAYYEEVKWRCVKGGIFPAFVNRQMEDVRKEMT